MVSIHKHIPSWTHASAWMGIAGFACAPVLANVDYTDLDVEALLMVEVTSVSKKKQKIGDAPAAIHVITQEDIRRSGVTSVADALRMVPGMEVAKINAHAWAVSSRGFNGYFASKLLVLIDGRSMYTPEFSGVYWETVDTLLEDIDRIEVIRGPGGTLWGANAVNGVINIITKQAKDTQGGLATLAAGNTWQGIGGVRYGGKINEHTHYRVYGKAQKFENSEIALVDDGWRQSQIGARMDGQQGERHRWTLQGDAYRNVQDEINWLNYQPESMTVSGMNLLGRWENQRSEQSSLQFQAYYDFYQRNLPIAQFKNQTVDLDFQHQWEINERNALIWGLAYRGQWNEFEQNEALHFAENELQTSLFSGFIQYDYQVIPDQLKIIIGNKLEHNDYTGWEIQPNLRALWTPTEKTSWWAAVSRAVRTPSRLENDSQVEIPARPEQNPFYPLPLVVRATGSEDFESETLIAYELGFRSQLSDVFSLDVAGFFNQYEKLIGSSFSFLPDAANQRMLMLQQGGINGADADAHGLEIATQWKILDWWQLNGALTFFNLDVKPDNGIGYSSGHFPNHQVSLRSQMNLSQDWDLDVWLRKVDDIHYEDSDKSVPGYAAMDVRVAWRPTSDLEVSLVGQNLFDHRHYEFITHNFNPLRSEVDRGIYAKVRWDF